MGTNFFCVEKISRRQRSKIKSLLMEYIGLVDKADTACDFHELHSKYNEMILDCIPEKVHLGKRSYGWQFLWDYHDGRYFKANLESIKEYLKDKIIVDEYGEVFSLDQFLDDEIGHCLYNADGKLEDGMKGYSRYTFISDDGLRFSKKKVRILVKRRITMRTIKFKAKSRVGEWVKGDLLQYLDGTVSIGDNEGRIYIIQNVILLLRQYKRFMTIV